MKIDHTKFKPLNNWVLIKPDENLETYQFRGKETGLYSPDFKYEHGKKIDVRERNVSVTGTVYAVCDEIQFYLNEIKHLRLSHTTHKKFNIQGTIKNVCIDRSTQKQIDTYYRSSSNFATDVEIKPMDRVNFSFLAHERCLQEGRIFETDLGVMYLIKYDQLYYTVGDNDEPVKMLNGFVVVEPDMIETKNFEVGGHKVEGFETETGILVANPKKVKKKKKIQLGTVKYFGNPCKGYLQEPDASDRDMKLGKDIKILYDSRGSTLMEYENHQIFSDKPLSLIQRKDILLTGYETELNLVTFD
jgi:hypothetical protein